MMRPVSSSSLVAIVVTALAAAVSTNAFSPAFVKQQQQHSSSTTRLFISSYSGGAGKSPYAFGSALLERENPQEQVQAYLKEPEAVEARSNIDGTCLVSGLVNAKDRTDQFLFDLLNHEESAFEFSKIIAFCNDVKFSKKRLLSRSARYTGLLDKLDFAEASSENALPTVDQLDGVKSWLAYVDANHLATLQQVANLAKSAPSVQNVAILLANANELVDLTSCQAALSTLQSDDNMDYTIVAVGQLQDDVPEGKHAYQYEEFGVSEKGVIPEGAVFSRQESYRMITELLQLAAGKNKALSFAEVYNQNITEAKLIKGLRSAGYARCQEIDHMVRDGPANYQKAIEEWKKANPDADKGYTSDAWWEADIYKKSRERSAARDAEKEQAVKDERTKEIETLAKEWAKREYFRQSMAGNIPNKDGAPMTEAVYIEEVIWDRALFEGDLKYRQLHGEVTNPDQELADFKAKQERKQQAMLERARSELAEVLDEENLGGDDLKQKWKESDKLDKEGGDNDE